MSETKKARELLRREIETFVVTQSLAGSSDRIVAAIDAYMLEWAVAHNLIVKRDPMD